MVSAVVSGTVAVGPVMTAEVGGGCLEGEVGGGGVEIAGDDVAGAVMVGVG